MLECQIFDINSKMCPMHFGIKNFAGCMQNCGCEIHFARRVRVEADANLVELRKLEA